MKTISNTNIINTKLTQPPLLEPKTLHQPPSSSRELHLHYDPQSFNPLLQMFLEKGRDGKMSSSSSPPTPPTLLANPETPTNLINSVTSTNPKIYQIFSAR